MISPRDVCSADHTRGADRRAVLQGDVALAVRLALAAADRLEAVPRDARTACLYRVALGHAPEHEVTSARRFADSGALTAYRFRRVADALARRRVRFRCRSQPG